MSPRRILGIHLGLGAVVALVGWSTGVVDPTGVLAGTGLLGASFWLLGRAVGYALGTVQRPLLAFLLFGAKLALLLGFGALGLKTVVRAPMSFAFGATLLPVAILLDTAFAARRGDGAAVEAGSDRNPTVVS